MNLENIQTGLDLFKTFELDRLQEKSKLNQIQNTLRDYVINLNDNWVADDVNTGFDCIENKFEPKTFDNKEVSNNENSDLVFESTLSSIPLNPDQFSLENNATQDGQLFETVSFFNAPGSKWSQPGGKGNPVNITYSYKNLLDGGLNGISAANAKTAIQQAFGVWSEAAPLNFTEVKDGSNSQIRIGYDYIDGQSNTLAFAYFPSNGDITFDSGDRWNTSLFLETAVHEIGHSLGLDHESGTGAIMNPSIQNRFNGLGSGFLLQDDINGIRSIYGSGRGSVNPLGGTPPTPEPTPEPTPTPSGPRRINGTFGDDVLVGNDRNNRIRGFAGDDYLEGGKGNDNIKGGKGADTFAFKSLDGSIDTIKDFSLAEGDRIEVSGSGFGASSSDDFVYDVKSGGLFFGNEQFAILENKPSFSSVDSGFVVT